MFVAEGVPGVLGHPHPSGCPAGSRSASQPGGAGWLPQPSAMPLSEDEKTLLSLVAKAAAPVAMSDFFEKIYPPALGIDENHPEHPA
ncbi:hypothetical protein GCM10009665_23220 [Kitasatospora nipponensis]|uniref:Uncharacterized protein n=1 Tax=Kitasatospora nipponensis TaxID=258049 RepID=A0ABN1W7J2_9ACTN